ncbi:interferon-induced very large GTPase 1-like [Osmerus mordax]|uniref:interferon-induced very large GTPase 1-like n=1 Tax=Osmerus mordax TaxID=8014 RepID=UPI00350F08F0
MENKLFAVDAKGNEKEHYDMSDTTSRAMGNSGFPLKNVTPHLTIALVGDVDAVTIGTENLLLYQDDLYNEVDEYSQIASRLYDLSGRHISVINMLGLNGVDFEKALQKQLCSQLKRNNQDVNAFLLLKPLGQHTSTDRTGPERLQEILGERYTECAVSLFTYENVKERETLIDDLKGKCAFIELMEKYGGRYHICNKLMNDPTEMLSLVEKINLLVSENKLHGYTVKMYEDEIQRRQEHLKAKAKHHKGQSLEQTESGETECVGGNVCVGEDKKQHFLEGKPHTEDSTENKLSICVEVGELLSRLNLLRRYEDKLTMADVLVINPSSPRQQETLTEKELVCIFLQKILAMDYTCRSTMVKESSDHTHVEDSSFDDFFEENTTTADSGNLQSHVHPMDLQMAVFHCSDTFLQQYIVSKLSLCQYALPFLVPNLITKEIECPLWAFRQIKKSWKSTDDSNTTTSKSMPISQAKTPMVAVFRLGSIPTSKSQLLSNLMNPRHSTFFHRNCPGSTKSSLLMDGVVEIAWYCPSGQPTDAFNDCVAFCNLHGDAVANEKHRNILSESASVNIVLITSPGKDEKTKAVLQKLFKSNKPLICLFTDENTPATAMKGKYKMGLRDLSQADVSEALQKIISESLSGSSCTFQLQEMVKNTEVQVNENYEDCLTGKNAALSMKVLIKGIQLSTIKQNTLPCQGELWHKWCDKNKELYRLTGHIEIENSRIQKEMKQIRKEQKKCAFSEYLQLFVANLQSLTGRERLFFLKWVGIQLDELSSNELSHIHHKYNEKWSEVLNLKKKHVKTEQLANQQKELENISVELLAATFGLEHLFREIGQIYEAYASLGNAEVVCNLPELAAELMISGHPVELMDGDAAHVPLTWIKSVLDQVIKKLGDQRVFVLSVLGIQSTGKSTMLNAMFGLQFAVSAGRCTRGAFMQLMKVADDKRAELKIDFVVVIDTEGLRALELAGRATLHHDNELATFVIGLGNMTLINIFGENPAEMQDIIQIAVQAFMRMKKVNLSPSCVFVHQNVGDIAAGEQNMEGKRRLQEKLDEMTQLAAKEEVCNVECFSDVIAFDIQRDVKYFAQLWEGSPPMAPPNPRYSRDVLELKDLIISKASQSGGITLSQFQSSIQDLWDALLNEKFVFSFKNTKEIAVHRKLETEYGKWTWELRCAMLEVEKTICQKIENGKLTMVEENIFAALGKNVIIAMEKYFSEDSDKEILIQWKGRFEDNIKSLINDLVKVTTKKLEGVIEQKKALKMLEEKKMDYEDKLFQKSKELALDIKGKEMGKKQQETAFDELWGKWVIDLTKNTQPIQEIDMAHEVTKILTEIHEPSLVYDRISAQEFPHIRKLGDYTNYLQTFQRKTHFSKFDKLMEKVTATLFLSSEDQNAIRVLIQRIMKGSEKNVLSKPISTSGYSSRYMQEIVRHVQDEVLDFQSNITKYVFRKGFIVDLSLFVCKQVEVTFSALHREFINRNAAHVQLQAKKSEYYSVFQKYLQGANSTTVLSELICNKLNASISHAIYEQATIDLATDMRACLPELCGNRSNLEKHILKSLAEEENFDMFMEYVHYPREHFEKFIKETVKKYVNTQNHPKVTTLIKKTLEHKKKDVVCAMASATTKVTKNKSKEKVKQWITSLSDELSDKLKFTDTFPNEAKTEDITDFDFLEQLIQKGLATITKEFETSLEDTSLLKKELLKGRPEESLIEHLCQCCWVKCPFCHACCTNTIEGHSTDHSIPFHRASGVCGVNFYLTDDLAVDFCQTVVASDRSFHILDEHFLYKEYRTGGPDLSCWSITADLSELPYWKWFICRFKSDLEKHYKKKFQGNGTIPEEWFKFGKKDAIAALEIYI